MNLPQPNPAMMGAPPQQGIDPGQLSPPIAPEQQDTSEDDSAYKLRALAEDINIAKSLDEDELLEIGQKAKAGFELDLQSRSQWDRSIDEWTKLAIQTKDNKTYPWPNASNVKYPLISTAAMQFAARAYPALVPANGNVVSATVVGKDPDGQKLAQADRVSTYMSYQVMHEVENWEESMDKLLIMLPVVGVIFKKTYWCSIKQEIVSEVVLPKNLVVNYWTTDLRTAERISQIIEMSPRLLKERQMSKSFLDIDLGTPTTPLNDRLLGKENKNQAPANDETTPYVIIEQHTYLDLDDDGYKEPYIVTFHRESGKVLRITARFDEDTMYFTDDNKLAKIEPIQYYTKFGFIPNPDGSFYDMGFGTLLGPINEAVNTIINQLIDAGTLNNLQSGFIGKGIRLKMGEQSFRPGEWKPVNATGSDLKQQILPLPTKEPSGILFQLMGALITSGKELASVAEIFTGKMPGQNTPATTTMATVEQGMKVFTAVYKRIYRSLNEEFQKMYALNGVYLNPQTYTATLDTTVGPSDFKTVNKVYSICPGADPSANSQQEKMQKVQELLQIMPMVPGLLDPVEVMRRYLDATEQPNADKLFSQAVQQTGQLPPPPPDPKVQELQLKMQADQAAAQQKGQAENQKMYLKQQDAQTQTAMKAQQAAIEQQHAQVMNALAEQSLSAKTRSHMVQQQVQTAQNIVNTQAQHEQKMRNMKQEAAHKPKPKGASK